MAGTLGLQGGNTGLAEGGQLSTVCLMAVPLSLYRASTEADSALPMMDLAYVAVAILAV